MTLATTIITETNKIIIGKIVMRINADALLSITHSVPKGTAPGKIIHWPLLLQEQEQEQ